MTVRLVLALLLPTREGHRTQEDEDHELDRPLRAGAARPIPEPRPELVINIIRRVRDSLLVGDLLRLVTLEVLWKSRNREDRDAVESQERQDS